MNKLLILFVSAFLIAEINGAPRKRTTPAPYYCNDYEVYLPQGSAPNCENVCSTLGDPCNIQYFQAPFGCYCEYGYARDENNVCIPIEQCPPRICDIPAEMEDY